MPRLLLWEQLQVTPPQPYDEFSETTNQNIVCCTNTVGVEMYILIIYVYIYIYIENVGTFSYFLFTFLS